jgi:hypothetical protein
MWKEIRVQLCAGYLFIYVTVNMMTLQLPFLNNITILLTAEVKRHYRLLHS